jgi:hypothetical protein
MPEVRCKFICQSVTKSKVYGEDRFIFSARFVPVTYDGGEENRRFFDATPSGELTLNLYREDLFIPGRAYYLDFTPS